MNDIHLDRIATALERIAEALERRENRAETWAPEDSDTSVDRPDLDLRDFSDPRDWTDR